MRRRMGNQCSLPRMGEIFADLGENDIRLAAVFFTC